MTSGSLAGTGRMEQSCVTAKGTVEKSTPVGKELVWSERETDEMSKESCLWSSETSGLETNLGAAGVWMVSRL